MHNIQIHHFHGPVARLDPAAVRCHPGETEAATGVLPLAGLRVRLRAEILATATTTTTTTATATATVTATGFGAEMLARWSFLLSSGARAFDPALSPKSAFVQHCLPGATE
jgi:hypothetical protein